MSVNKVASPLPTIDKISPLKANLKNPGHKAYHRIVFGTEGKARLPAAHWQLSCRSPGQSTEAHENFYLQITWRLEKKGANGE